MSSLADKGSQRSLCYGKLAHGGDSAAGWRSHSSKKRRKQSLTSSLPSTPSYSGVGGVSNSNLATAALMVSRTGCRVSRDTPSPAAAFGSSSSSCGHLAEASVASAVNVSPPLLLLLNDGATTNISTDCNGGIALKNRRQSIVAPGAGRTIAGASNAAPSGGGVGFAEGASSPSSLNSCPTSSS